MNFQSNQYLTRLESMFKQEIENTFDQIKHSATPEEIAYHRGLMNGMQYCVSVVEVERVGRN